MQGDYISIADFKHFKTTRALPALEVVGTNLRNENKLNQVAARMLGYSSYEALQPFHAREQAIREGVYAERCPIQGGRFTLKSRNLVVVFDKREQKILFRALFPGQEREAVTDQNATRVVLLNAEDDLTYDFAPVSDSLKQESQPEGQRLSFEFVALANPLDDSSAVPCQCDAIATEEGLVVNLYVDIHGDFSELDSVALEYIDDATPEQVAAVDQVSAPFAPQAAGLDGHFYHFRKVAIDHEGKTRLLAQEWDDEMMPLTGFVFASKQEVREFLDEEDWSYGWGDLEGLVLCEVTRKVVPL